MNIQESINRGFNLLATSIVGIAGFAFLPETIIEKDVPDKIDDTLLFILAVSAIYWYNKSNNRYVRSSLPVAFVVTGLIIKTIGLIIEHDDPEALGDDAGGLILFVLSTALIIRQFKTSATLAAGNAAATAR